MTSRLNALAAAASLLSLAGCGAETGRLSAGYNPSLYSVHQPVVQQSEYVMDIVTAGGFGVGEDQRLRAWFGGLQLGYGDRVALSPTDEASRAAIARLAAHFGLLLEDTAPLTPGVVPPGTVRVVVSRTTASVPGCPDWSQAKNPGAPISTDSNYGCATNANLAAMIADPADLVRGRSSGQSSSAAAAAAPVKVYRDRPYPSINTVAGTGGEQAAAGGTGGGE